MKKAGDSRGFAGRARSSHPRSSRGSADARPRQETGEDGEPDSVRLPVFDVRAHDRVIADEIAAAVQFGAQTARSVVDAALARAERYQERFHPFITLTAEPAREQADRVDDAVRRGARMPLAGVPFAVKDLIDVEGFRTTCGSRAFADRVAGGTATVVEQLIGSGAVLVGKTNMHECAFGFTGENPAFGDCPNPWDAQRFSGGSSSAGTRSSGSPTEACWSTPMRRPPAPRSPPS